MTTDSIISKVWSFCNTLRDDGGAGLMGTELLSGTLYCINCLSLTGLHYWRRFAYHEDGGSARRLCNLPTWFT